MRAGLLPRRASLGCVAESGGMVGACLTGVGLEKNVPEAVERVGLQNPITDPCET